MRLAFHLSKDFALRRRLADERGFTLIELTMTMVILGTVVASLTGLFASTMKSEADLNNRAQAQTQARLAVTKLTRELHCANQIKQSNGSALTSTAVSGINLTLPAGCPTGGASAISVSWCTVSSTPAGHYDLYRYSSTGCASGGVRWATSLINSTPFSLPTSISPGVNYPLVHLELKVNTLSNTNVGTYDLIADVAALNGTRS